jgi:hypothetical protein
MVALGPRRELNEVEEAPRMTARVDVDRIDGKPRTVRELFTDRKYSVDYYQREYAWTQANVFEFLNDWSGRFALREERPVAPRGLPNGKVTTASATSSADGNGSLDVKALEMWLWDAASQIRGPLDAPKFKYYILPLIFLERLSYVFDDEVQRVADEVGDLDTAKEIIDQDQDHALVRFYVPAESRWPRALNLFANRQVLHGVSECA